MVVAEEMVVGLAGVNRVMLLVLTLELDMKIMKVTMEEEVVGLVRVI